MTAEQQIFQELRALRVDMQRMLGTRLDMTEMSKRLGITRRTLYNRIQAGSVPRPIEGKWLLAEVMEWEARNQSIATI